MGSPSEEKALYVGEAGNRLTDGTPLIPGETICLVGAGEAEASDLWQPIKDGEPASPLPRNSPPAAPTGDAAPAPADTPPDEAA